jgi:acetyl esterase/lipase
LNVAVEGDAVDLFQALDRDLIEPIKKLPKVDFDSKLKVFLIQALTPKGPGVVDGVKAQNHKVGSAKVRIFEPENPGSGAMVWIHGGGLILGKPEQDDFMLSEIARDLKIRIFALGYRVAPKHPFPTPLNDCITGYEWVLDNAKGLGIDTSNIVLAGASAGGCLAQSLALTLRDSGRSPKATALLYPMLDDRTAAKLELDGTSLIWTNKSNRWAWTQYLGYEAGKNEPLKYSVPGRAEDLTGLAPTWIGVGDVDLFYAEDVVFANRLLLAGVETQLKVFKGYPHAAETMVPNADISKRFKADLTSFVRQQLGRERVGY